MSIERNLTAGTTTASVWANNQEQFYCTASGCHQSVDTSTGDYKWQCENTACNCIFNSLTCGKRGVDPGIDLSSFMGILSSPLYGVFPNGDQKQGVFHMKKLDSFFSPRTWINM